MRLNVLYRDNVAGTDLVQPYGCILTHGRSCNICPYSLYAPLFPTYYKNYVLIFVMLSEILANEETFLKLWWRIVK
jgi:hypothetical protein